MRLHADEDFPLPAAAALQRLAWSRLYSPHCGSAAGPEPQYLPAFRIASSDCLARPSAECSDIQTVVLRASRTSMSPMFFIAAFRGGVSSHGAGCSTVLPSGMGYLSGGKRSSKRLLPHSEAGNTMRLPP